MCHCSILDTAKNFRVPVNLCHFDSSIVLFHIFLPPSTFSHQSASEVEKYFMEKKTRELFLEKKNTCVYKEIFKEIERCFLPFSAAWRRKKKTNPTQFLHDLLRISHYIIIIIIIWNKTLWKENWEFYHNQCLFVIISF